MSAAPERCPAITVRDGTRTLSGNGYSATILQTTRSCGVVDGRLAVEVRVAGDVSFEGAAGDGVELPIRVAIVDGERVLYSQLGRLAVAPSSATFTYLDAAPRLAEPAAESVVIYVGFDERN